MLAVRVLNPTVPVSFTPRPAKSATPATAFMVVVPPIVAPVADSVTSAVEPVTTLLLAS